jgi:hypothetical protein
VELELVKLWQMWATPKVKPQQYLIFWSHESYLHPTPLPLTVPTDYSLLQHSDLSLCLQTTPCCNTQTSHCAYRLQPAATLRPLTPHTLNLRLLPHILKLTFTLRGLPWPNAQLGAHTGCISPHDVPRSAFVSNPAIIRILGPYFSTIQVTKQGCWWRITQDFCTSIVVCLTAEHLTRRAATYSSDI